MHAKPGLRVVLKWMIYRSGSVIAAVIQLLAQPRLRDTELLPVKISIKWILLLTVLVCLHLSVPKDSQFTLLAISALVMLLTFPVVSFSRWKIADEDGWWKFQGSSVARVSVWIYFLGLVLSLIHI